MTGTVATFRLDLISIPCFIPARGTKSDISIRADLGQFPVGIVLTSERSPGMKKPDEQDHRYFYNKLAITITKADEDLAGCDFIESRARYLLMEFQGIVIEAINRLIRYCKYVKHHPNLREISIIDLLDQEAALCNPDWRTIEGEAIRVSAEPLETGIISIPGIGLLQDGFFGIEPMAGNEGPRLEQHFRSEPAVGLTDQLLSDAQGAALNNNVRRAVLELAITIEVFVKNAFLKRERIAGAAFEYLEDKGREMLKVIELLDGAAQYAFGESFKTASPDSYRHIDYVFRCRNKVAHRGEARFRDDTGAWQEVDHEHLRAWWSATLEMFAWLEQKAAQTGQ